MAYEFGNKIGEYIHLHYKNYQRQGLVPGGKAGKITSGKVEDLSRYVNATHNQLIQIFNNAQSQAHLVQLQRNLNLIMGQVITGNTGGLHSEDVNIIRQHIYTYMSDMFTGLQETDIDWETLTIKPGSLARLQNIKTSNDAITLSLKTLRSSMLGGKQGHFYGAAFRRHVNDIEQGIKSLVGNISSGTSDIESLQNRLSALRDKANTFMGTQLVATNQPLLQELRDLARDVFKLGSKVAIEGELAEAVVSAAGAMISSQSQKTFNELIRSFTQGSAPGVNIIADKAFYSQVNQSAVFANSGYQDVGFRWQTRSNHVLGKIDNVITLDNTTLLVSTKSYNLNNPKLNHISLVNDTNMIYLLQTESAFLNHYLNQSVNSIAKNGRQVGPPQAVIAKANLIMKEMLALRALVGGGLRNNPIVSGKMANVFAVNDKSQPCGFRVISMGGLFNNIRHNLDDITIKPDPTQWLWKNKYANTAGERITNLLADVRKTKISASINFNAIRRNLF